MPFMLDDAVVEPLLPECAVSVFREVVASPQDAGAPVTTAP